MVGQKQWIYAFQAVAIVRRDLRPYHGLKWLDTDDAARELAWTCERGEVRSQYKEHSGAIKPIPPEFWHPAQIDWARCILHSGSNLSFRPCQNIGNCATSCFHEVQINRRDIGTWIDRAKRADAFLAETREPTLSLKVASTRRIDETIRAVNDDAENNGNPAPNINKLAAEVQLRLRSEGYSAIIRTIRRVAQDPEHAGRRRPRGKTLASERRGKPD
jgi:hypothetical protein